MLHSSFSERWSPSSSASHESAHQVVRRCRASAREERVEIRDELVGVSREAARPAQASSAEHERVRPFPEPRSVLGRDAEELGDHRDRKQNAKSSTSSICPRSTTRSIELVGDLLDRADEAARPLRGVNAFVTRRRRRRWSSPSFDSRFSLTRDRLRRARPPRVQRSRRARAPVRRVEHEMLVVGEAALRRRRRRVTNQMGVRRRARLEVDRALLARTRIRRVRREPEVVAVEVEPLSARHARAMMSRREPQADARVRRDGLPRLGAPARPANGRGSRARRSRRRVSALGRPRRLRAVPTRRPRDRPGRERRRRRRAAARIASPRR